MIAAGSTGSIPATAELIATIARLPHGAVVLPGLDTDLDEASWRMIAGDASKDIAPAPGHPQFAMQALLARIGIARDAVRNLAEPSGRERLTSEVLRPASATDLWRQLPADPAFGAQADAVLRSISVIEAANAEEESLAVAVALREAVNEGKTAALVTPDRALGRRVLAALAALEHRGGRFGRRSARRHAGRDFRTACGRRPRSAGLPRSPCWPCSSIRCCVLARNGRAVAALERAVLRGPRPRPGSAGLAHALQSFRAELEKFRRKESSDLHPSDPRVTLGESELAGAADLVVELSAALVPLESVANQSHRLSEIVARHRDVVAALSRQGGHEAAFAGADGAKLAEAFDELATSEAAADLAGRYVRLCRTFRRGARWPSR